MGTEVHTEMETSPKRSRLISTNSSTASTWMHHSYRLAVVTPTNGLPLPSHPTLDGWTR
jgi:hypothetical protein